MELQLGGGRAGNAPVRGGEGVDNSQLDVVVAGGGGLERFPLGEVVEAAVVLGLSGVFFALHNYLEYIDCYDSSRIIEFKKP